MPFQNHEDHKESLWQIILRKTQTQASNASPDEILAKYSKIAIDGGEEVKRVIDYLISTVMEMK